MSSDGKGMHPHGQIHVTHVMISADTLAVNWIRGFKEEVSFALKTCRCEIESAHIKVFLNRFGIVTKHYVDTERFAKQRSSVPFKIG